MILMQDERFLRTVLELREALAPIDGSGFILTDKSISVVYPERYFPSDAILKSMYNVSIAAYNSRATFMKAGEKSLPRSPGRLFYISLIVFVSLVLWMLFTRS
jgi:hypothetical protein